MTVVVEVRARQSRGISNDPMVYRAVADAVTARHPGGGILIDVGCGAGNLWSYPAHLTALLEADLRRIGGECGWLDVAVAYTGSGRIPGTVRHWPQWLSRLVPRTLSDNVLVIGRKPANGIGAADGRRGD